MYFFLFILPMNQAILSKKNLHFKMQNFLHFTTTNLYSIIIILQLHQLLFFPIYFDMSSPIFHMTPEIAPLFLKGMGGPKQDPKGLLRLHLKFKSAAKGKPVLWSAESLAKTYGESHSTFLMKYSKFPIQERERTLIY